MRKISVKTGVTAAFALALASFAGAHNDAWAANTNALVKCAQGDLIADAIAGGATQITIRGTCTEIVTVTTDDITFSGHPGIGGTLIGGFIVDGAHRVVIDDLTVTGSPDHGVLARGGASVTVSNSTIIGNSRFGIIVLLGATAQINGNDITGNGENAVIVVEEGSARLRNNTITTAFIPGAIGVFRNASLRLNGGNTITNTNVAGNAIGIVAFHVSNIRQDNVGDRGPDVLTANRVVAVGNMSTVDLRAFVATGNASVGAQGSLRLRNGTFNGDISAFAFSTVPLSNGFIVNGNAIVGNMSDLSLTDGTFNGDINVSGINSIAIKLSGVTFTGTCFPSAFPPSSPGLCLNF